MCLCCSFPPKRKVSDALTGKRGIVFRVPLFLLSPSFYGCKPQHKLIELEREETSQQEQHESRIERAGGFWPEQAFAQLTPLPLPPPLHAMSLDFLSPCSTRFPSITENATATHTLRQTKRKERMFGPFLDCQAGRKEEAGQRVKAVLKPAVSSGSQDCESSSGNTGWRGGKKNENTD